MGEVHAKRRHGGRRRALVVLGLAVALLLSVRGIGTLGQAFGGGSYLVPTNSMAPRIRAGDRIQADVGIGDPRRGEVWVFRGSPRLFARGSTLIKRVVGLPGERVEVADTAASSLTAGPCPSPTSPRPQPTRWPPTPSARANTSCWAIIATPATTATSGDPSRATSSSAGSACATGRPTGSGDSEGVSDSLCQMRSGKPDLDRLRRLATELFQQRPTYAPCDR